MFIIVPLLLVAIFGGIFWWSAQKRKQQASWPSTLGVITDSRMERINVGGGGSEDKSVIGYRYQVGGTSYASYRVKAGFLPGGQTLLNRYPVGKQVEVFYNPQNPNDAALER
jgi:hypothetical protein